MVHERWLAALETAKSNTNFQSVLWPDATKCSLTLTRVGGAVPRLARPLYHSTSCFVLSCSLPKPSTHSFHTTHNFYAVNS